MSEVIKRQIIAAKASLQAADAALDVVLAGIIEQETAGLTTPPVVCQHTNKHGIGTMTNPRAFYCPACGATGDTTTITDDAHGMVK